MPAQYYFTSAYRFWRNKHHDFKAALIISFLHSTIITSLRLLPNIPDGTLLSIIAAALGLCASLRKAAFRNAAAIKTLMTCRLSNCSSLNKRTVFSACGAFLTAISPGFPALRTVAFTRFRIMLLLRLQICLYSRALRLENDGYGDGLLSSYVSIAFGCVR